MHTEFVAAVECRRRKRRRRRRRALLTEGRDSIVPVPT